MKNICGLESATFYIILAITLFTLNVILPWCAALWSLRSQNMPESTRFRWAVFVTLVPFVGSMAFLIVKPYNDVNNPISPSSPLEDSGIGSITRGDDPEITNSIANKAPTGEQADKKKHPPYGCFWFIGFLVIFLASLLGGLISEFLVLRLDILHPLLGILPAYNKVVLLESRVQPTGVFVRYCNTGDKTISSVDFKFKYYDKTGLVDESTEYYYESVPPGKSTEGIIMPERFCGDKSIPILLKGRTVKVICTRGEVE